MKTLLKYMLVVTFIVQSQYVVNGLLLCDYSLQGEKYVGVYYEDMMDALNTALEQDAN